MGDSTFVFVFLFGTIGALFFAMIAILISRSNAKKRITIIKYDNKKPEHSKQYYQAVDSLKVNNISIEVAKTAAFLDENPIVNK